jgi:hypothetical protein
MSCCKRAFPEIAVLPPPDDIVAQVLDNFAVSECHVHCPFWCIGSRAKTSLVLFASMVLKDTLPDTEYFCKIISDAK